MSLPFTPVLIVMLFPQLILDIVKCPANSCCEYCNVLGPPCRDCNCIRFIFTRYSVKHTGNTTKICKYIKRKQLLS